MRTKSPSPAYLTAAPYTPTVSSTPNLFSRLFIFLRQTLSRFLEIFKPRSTFWKLRLFHHGPSYREHLSRLSPLRYSLLLCVAAAIFQALRFLPSGHSASLHVQSAADPATSPYQIFYNVYKPATPFKKSTPPKPDFQVVVVEYVLHPT